MTAGHEHNWTEHPPGTVGGQAVWTCDGCPLYSIGGDLALYPAGEVVAAILDHQEATNADCREGPTTSSDRQCDRPRLAIPLVPPITESKKIPLSVEIDGVKQIIGEATLTKNGMIIANFNEDAPESVTSMFKIDRSHFSIWK